MAISKLNGTNFRKLIINGAINLKNNYQEIDQLNVFPVPDGDTGTNMQMTIMAGVREINSLDTNSIVELCKYLSRGLLMGARGNSGVILSQFFRGIFVGMKNISGFEATPKDFVNCLVSGSEMAYKAVMEPVEGTILTVVRESAEKVSEKINSFKTIDEVIDAYLEQARVSLANTPNVLPLLKEANVVDSGGAGFIKVIEGIQMALQGKILELEHNDEKATTVESMLEEVDIKFGYCTEFIVSLTAPKSFDEADLRQPLSILGDSIVLVKDEEIVKVHIHTNHPGRVLTTSMRFGEFLTVKIENMRTQHSELINKNQVSKPKERKKYGIIAVCFGKGIKDTFKSLGVDYIIDGGQTMNPSTEEFVKAVNEINADNIIIIPNNSNVILSAEQTMKICENENIRVLKAKDIAQGYASLMVFDANQTLDENIDQMTNVVKTMKSGEITYAVRTTEIKGVKIKAGDYMGISSGNITISNADRVKSVKGLLKTMVSENTSIITIFAGDDVGIEELDLVQAYINKLNENIEIEIIEGNQEIYSYIIAAE